MVIRVLHMCLVFHLVSLPVLMVQMMCDDPLWSLSFTSFTNLCIHGPPSSHCIAIIDPMEKTDGSL